MCLKVNGFPGASPGGGHISEGEPSGSSQPTEAGGRGRALSEKTGCTFVLAELHPCTIDAFGRRLKTTARRIEMFLLG
jgi:hypothetical protein